MRDDSFQSTYYLWRGHSGKVACHPSALLLVARESCAIVGIFWSELRVWVQAFLTTPSTLCHPPVHTNWYRHMCAHTRTQLHVNTHVHALPSSSVAWSSCKVPKSAFCILGRWERTSWKQWNGLICGFASGFDKGRCSKPKFLWPLVKNVSSSACPPLPPSFLLWIGWEWITRGAVSLIKIFTQLHSPLLLTLQLLLHIRPPRQSSHSLFLLAFWHNRYNERTPNSSKAQWWQGHKSKVNP